MSPWNSRSCWEGTEFSYSLKSERFRVVVATTATVCKLLKSETSHCLSLSLSDNWAIKWPSEGVRRYSVGFYWLSMGRWRIYGSADRPLHNRLMGSPHGKTDGRRTPKVRRVEQCEACRPRAWEPAVLKIDAAAGGPLLAASRAVRRHEIETSKKREEIPRRPPMGRLFFLLGPAIDEGK